MKLIDADKLLAWMEIAFEKESKDRYEKGKRDMHTMVEALIHQGHFDPGVSSSPKEDTNVQ